MSGWIQKENILYHLHKSSNMHGREKHILIEQLQCWESLIRCEM